jgi:hypothetical protein
MEEYLYIVHTAFMCLVIGRNSNMRLRISKEVFAVTVCQSKNREEVEEREAASRQLQDEVEAARHRIEESEAVLRREMEMSR